MTMGITHSRARQFYLMQGGLAQANHLPQIHFLHFRVAKVCWKTVSSETETSHPAGELFKQEGGQLKIAPGVPD